MPIISPLKAAIPEVTVPTFVFTSPSAPLPNDPLILDAASPDTDFLTLSSYRHWSQRFAVGLQNVGFKKGDILLFVSGNNLAYPVVLMGTLMAGGVLSGASTAHPPAKLLSQAAAVEPTIILASDEGYQMSLDVATSISLPHERVFPIGPEQFFNKTPSTRREREFPWADADSSFDWLQISSPDEVAVVNFTSGSTGDAKGVVVTHRNMVANAAQYMEVQKNNPFGREQDPNATWVSWAPMFHVIAQNQYCIIAPKRGLTNYIMEQFDLGLLLKYAEKYKATELVLLPPILIALLHHPDNRKYDLSSVSVVSCGGAPIRESVLKKLENLMPHESFTVVQGWGMTEVTSMGIYAQPIEPDLYTAGQLMPNCEAKIMSADGKKELGPNEPGELWFRGPNVTQGYWKRPEKTEETFFPDSWLRTGDFGYYNEEERWHIRDRVQDVILTADGNYVLPTDLESTLLDFPNVTDAGLTAVQSGDKSTNMVPRAFVAIDHNIGADTVDSIGKAFNAKVKDHECLRGGIFEIETIPRLVSGKIDRRTLREMKVNSVDGEGVHLNGKM